MHLPQVQNLQAKVEALRRSADSAQTKVDILRRKHEELEDAAPVTWRASAADDVAKLRLEHNEVMISVQQQESELCSQQVGRCMATGWQWPAASSQLWVSLDQRLQYGTRHRALSGCLADWFLPAPGPFGA